jgi:hypothetical protein
MAHREWEHKARRGSRSQPAVGTSHYRCMGDLILAGVLTWLMVFVWWGTNLVLRADGRHKAIGGFLLVLGLVPTVIALWVAA